MKHCILINFYPNFNIKLDSDPENYCINTGRYHCNALIHIVVIFLLMMILNRHCIILARWLNVNIKLHCLVLLQRRDKWTFPMAHIVVKKIIPLFCEILGLLLLHVMTYFSKYSVLKLHCLRKYLYKQICTGKIFDDWNII